MPNGNTDRVSTYMIQCTSHVYSHQLFLYLPQNHFMFYSGIWVHLEGETSPQFDSSGHVTGTDKTNSLISDLHTLLQDAKAHNVFVFLCLWNAAVKQNYHYRLDGLIKDTDKLQVGPLFKEFPLKCIYFWCISRLYFFLKIKLLRTSYISFCRVTFLLFS